MQQNAEETATTISHLSSSHRQRLLGSSAMLLLQAFFFFFYNLHRPLYPLQPTWYFLQISSLSSLLFFSLPFQPLSFLLFLLADHSHHPTSDSELVKHLKGIIKVLLNFFGLLICVTFIFYD